MIWTLLMVKSELLRIVMLLIVWLMVWDGFVNRILVNLDLSIMEP